MSEIFKPKSNHSQESQSGSKKTSDKDNSEKIYLPSSDSGTSNALNDFCEELKDVLYDINFEDRNVLFRNEIEKRIDKLKKKHGGTRK